MGERESAAGYEKTPFPGSHAHSLRSYPTASDPNEAFCSDALQAQAAAQVSDTPAEHSGMGRCLSRRGSSFHLVAPTPPPHTHTQASRERPRHVSQVGTALWGPTHRSPPRQVASLTKPAQKRKNRSSQAVSVHFL